MIDNIILGSRKTGRTSTLIELCGHENSQGRLCYIVCHDHQAAYQVAQRAQEKGLNIPFPLTYDEFRTRSYYSPNIDSFLMDNVDMFLQWLAGPVHIKAVTLEKPEGEL